MPRLLYATDDGSLREDQSLNAIARSGWELDAADTLIPLPPGTTLMHLPARRPLGRSASGQIVEPDDPGAQVVGAVLPPGYLRTWLPAYREQPPAPVLPLYGYAAVASVDGEPRVAALPTDHWDAWDPQALDRRRIGVAIRKARRSLPDSRLLAQLVTCATDYRCLTAQNVFLRRGEGAIPVSPACNAACLGCISEQWGDVDSPQTRLAFAPSAGEIAELGGWHLSAGAENFVSFGQGCEGEPLTRGAALVEATRRIRAAAPTATIHINTNGSRPEVLRRLLDAGLNSVRISIFSLDDASFRAYYRPIGYGLEQVRESAEVVGAAGGQVTINLLTFPGITDSPEEIELLADFVRRQGVHQLQLRSLNVDPHWLLARIPRRSAGIGMRQFVKRIKTACPDLKLGNFTRPWPLVERPRVWASL
ncbi:MAG TPA: radical SAM protein [Candidatus Dormibacteraeota bacterium]|nr:radical SAM protein [Candidatus Dormibacteraeota bacterium]